RRAIRPYRGPFPRPRSLVRRARSEGNDKKLGGREARSCRTTNPAATSWGHAPHGAFSPGESQAWHSGLSGSAVRPPRRLGASPPSPRVVPASDWVMRRYTGDKDGSSVWSTVTPVVLPGYDDPDHLRRRLADEKNATVRRRLYERLDARVESLLRKAIIQTGYSATLADCAELSWRMVGFRPGLDLATNYTSPDHLRGKPRYHVRIRWKDAHGRPVNICGPVVIGAGRYCGLGLFAAEE